MPHVTCRSALTGAALLLFACLFGSLAASAAPLPQATSWSRLATVSPGTAVVVSLSDGRHLQRYIVSVDSDALVVADLNRISSSDRRSAALDLLRNQPARFMASATIEDAGQRVEIVERFDRQSILTVARPDPYRFKPGILGWFLASSGPCPNCDARQTIPLGRTVLPSPLSASAASRGDVLYEARPLRADALPHDLTWPRLQEWLRLPATSPRMARR
jgi:hypothetical protein